MQLTHNFVDIAASSVNGELSDVIHRDSLVEIWYVPFSPLRFDKAADWRFYKRNDAVVIPLFPYLVPALPGAAFGFLFQLGVNAVSQLGGKPVKRLHLSIGNPVVACYDEQSGQNVWSFQLGVAVLFE